VSLLSWLVPYVSEIINASVQACLPVESRTLSLFSFLSSSMHHSVSHNMRCLRLCLCCLVSSKPIHVLCCGSLGLQPFGFPSAVHETVWTGSYHWVMKDERWFCWSCRYQKYLGSDGLYSLESLLEPELPCCSLLAWLLRGDTCSSSC
jgi:hypothetical protein